MKEFALFLIGFSSFSFVMFYLLKNPKVGMQWLIVLLPIIYQSRRIIYVVFGPFIVTPFLVLVLTVFASVVYNKYRIDRKVTLGALFLCFCCLLLSLIHPDIITWSLRGWQLAVLEPLLFFICVYVFFDNKIIAYKTAKLSFVFVFAVVLCEIILSGGISIHALATRQANIGQGGFTGGLDEPAVLANYLVFFIPLILLGYYETRKAIYLVILLLMVSVLILTFTRSAMIILFIDVVIIAIFSSRGVFLKISSALSILFFAMVTYYIYLFRVTSSEKYSVIEEFCFQSVCFDAGGGLLQRLSSMSDGLDLIFDPFYIFLGRGGFSEIDYWWGLSDLTLSLLNPISSVGNGFITIAIYFGIPVMFFVIYSLYRIIMTTLSSRLPREESVLLSLIPFNLIIFLFFAQGGLVAYGFESHFPSWKDKDFIYSGFVDGIQFLPTNMNLIYMLFCLAVCLSISKRSKNHDK